MKLSEAIKVLQSAQEEYGDRELVLVGWYGAQSETFEIQTPTADATAQNEIHLWTDINTG